MITEYSETENPWESVQRQEVYDNNWITVVHEDVITPAGTAGIYGSVHFKHYAIGIVPLDEVGNTWLVGQYRYPLKKYSWEIPEGGGKLGASILDAAKRELQEEVGLLAEQWTEIAVCYTSNAVCDEKAIIFVAQGLSETENAPDETEQLQIKKLPLSEAIAMAMNGEIQDAISIIGLLKVKVLLEQGKICRI